MSNSKENSPVVLQVLPELEMGGVERGTVEIATYMQQHGIKNFVASQGGRMVYDLEKAKVPHLTLPLKSKIFSKCGLTPKSWNSLSVTTALTSFMPVPVRRPGALIGQPNAPAFIL